MSAHLAQLYADYLATRGPGSSPVATVATEAALRAYAVAVGHGLLFPHRLVRVARTEYPINISVTHIVPAESIAIGSLLRLTGDALCRPRWRIGGIAGQLRPVEEGATCYPCLEIAEAHSIPEWQEYAIRS